MKYNTVLSAKGGTAALEKGGVCFASDGSSTEAAFSITYTFPEWEKDSYIFLPACVYGGNRMEKRYGDYPVSYALSDLSENPAPVITDIPALSPDGSGKIEVTAADLSVPCFGIYYREKKEALLVFTEQTCKGKNIGFSVEAGRVTVQLPAMREHTYRMGNSAYPSEDRGFAAVAGEQVHARLHTVAFLCASLPAFFKVFFENRRCLLSDAAVPLAYTAELREALEAHMNRDCFGGEYYSEMNKNFKCGWVGGVFAYPCWSATSLLLTYAELISNEGFMRDAAQLSKEKEKYYAG